MGFYTIEIKNLETGSVQAKHDLLVMENLFYDQKVARSFDLKGIQSRRVKLASDGTQRQTLFDGEWIEGNWNQSHIYRMYSLSPRVRTATSTVIDPAALRPYPSRSNQIGRRFSCEE
jgi:Phosphatidylinositol-4-phosphate 5-Kinase